MIEVETIVESEPGPRPASIESTGVMSNKIAALKMLARTIVSELGTLEKANGVSDDVKIDLADEVQRFESDIIRSALVRTGGRQRQAARLLQIKPTTLNAKIKRYGIIPSRDPAVL